MKTAEEITELLMEFESEDLLDYSYEGMLIWPMIRFNLLDDLQGKLSHRKEGNSRVIMDRPVWKRRIETYLNLLRLMPRALYLWPRNRDLVYIGYKAYYRIVNGKLFNPIYGPFGALYPDKSLLCDLSADKMALDLNGIFPVRDFYWTRILSGKLTKYTSKSLGKMPEKIVESIAERSKKILGVQYHQKDLDKIKNKIEYVAKFSDINKKLWMKIFRFLNPKMIFLKDGMYGHVGMVTAARELGISVCEPQHGLIGLQHVAYTHAKINCANKNYKAAFPDYFLTYGEHWNNNCIIPSKVITIGNPYLSMRMNDKSKGNNILICLGDVFDVFMPYIEALKTSYKVIVRPHPNRVAEFHNHQISRMECVSVDKNLDVYDTLQECSVVLTKYSTVGYEAAALGKRVFRIVDTNETDLFATMPFEKVTNPKELMDILRDNSSGYIDDKLISGWFSPNWESNFRDFIEQYI